MRDYVTSRTWMPDQAIHERPDGRFDLTFTATGVELRSHVLQFGGQVEVIAPSWLRAMVQEELRAALDRYGVDTLPSAGQETGESDVQCPDGDKLPRRLWRGATE